MNKLTIIGNLTRDPESHTLGERTVCNFTVAVNRKKKTDSQPDADFFRVAAWGKLGEICQKYLAKSRKVCVVGPVSVSTYQAQDGSTRANLEVYAEDVEFLSSAGSNGQDAMAETAHGPNSGTVVDMDGSELPF